jgi:hypothetical protein
MTAAATAPPPDTAPQQQAAPPPEAAPTPGRAPTPEETGQEVVSWLTAMVLYGRPRSAIAAFEALVALDEYFQETMGRMVELSKDSRPRVAARAVKALVRAKLAYRRHRDGRSPLLFR